MDEHRVDLADAIEAIRDQLVTAAVRGAGSELAFEVGDIQLEFTVQLSHDRTAKGGVKAWVLTAGYESAQTRADTQRVSVTLKPKQRTSGADVLVGNDNAPDLDGF
ncbi:trypco2 family protein [Streptacidiphilus neutrinimicus]|uniref:trypco2 family protein n=1 Tax=Streptacidiphilus neutrinimicus TaxID=105420 RepID=UPI0005A7FD71|nr:trypco2 family protein [Streptacidiphilus neutrinimicus]